MLIFPFLSKPGEQVAGLFITDLAIPEAISVDYFLFFSEEEGNKRKVPHVFLIGHFS